jgi:hypothetical protein
VTLGLKNCRGITGLETEIGLTMSAWQGDELMAHLVFETTCSGRTEQDLGALVLLRPPISQAEAGRSLEGPIDLLHRHFLDCGGWGGGPPFT